MIPNNNSSLRIARPRILPVVITSVFLFCVFIIFELLIATTWINEILPYPSPSINSIFPELDVKFQRLYKNNHIDCLFFGSSMIDAGINPQLFEETLNPLINSKPACLNMGFSSSMVETSSVIATTLAKWRPLKLVVFGISPIEMKSNSIITRSISKMPVFTFYNGGPSFQGWLFNRFYFPWYFSSLPRLNNKEYLTELSLYERILDDRGERHTDKIMIREEENLGVLLPEFEINPVDMNVFKNSLQKLEDEGVQVFVVEMPVHPSFFPNLVEGGPSQYKDRFFLPIKKYLDLHNIPFIPTQSRIGDIVDDKDWANRNHLNSSGAEKFSIFLAKQIAEAGYNH